MTDVSVRPNVWKFQVQVIKALMLRDMMSRFGQSRLSYLWALLQPILAVFALLLVFSVRSRMAPPNLPLMVFVLSGYTFWFAFQSLWSALAGIEKGAEPMLMFPQITVLDVIIAKVALEFATQTTYYVLVVGAFIIVGGLEFPDDPMGVLMAYWACIWLGSGVGLFAASIRRFFPMFEDWLSPVRRLGLFFSGVVFTAASLPNFVLDYLSWNPVFRSIEIARQAWHPTYQSPIYDPLYVLYCCIGVTAVAMIIERGTRRYAGL